MDLGTWKWGLLPLGYGVRPGCSASNPSLWKCAWETHDDLSGWDSAAQVRDLEEVSGFRLTKVWAQLLQALGESPSQSSLSLPLPVCLWEEKNRKQRKRSSWGATLLLHTITSTGRNWVQQLTCSHVPVSESLSVSSTSAYFNLLLMCTTGSSRWWIKNLNCCYLCGRLRCSSDSVPTPGLAPEFASVRGDKPVEKVKRALVLFSPSQRKRNQNRKIPTKNGSMT